MTTNNQHRPKDTDTMSTYRITDRPDLGTFRLSDEDRPFVSLIGVTGPLAGYYHGVDSMANLEEVPDELEADPSERWMVVDKNRASVIHRLTTKAEALEEAAELNDPTNTLGDGRRPFRVVRDIVAEDMARPDELEEGRP